jgi:trk system potassium uptake protein
MFRLLSRLFAFTSLGLFLYYYGFAPPPDMRDIILDAVKLIFVFFVLNYGVKLLFNLNRIEFIKSNWFETIIVILLIYDGISYFFLGIPLLEQFFIGIGIENYFPFYILFIQLYLLLFVGLELAKLGEGLTRLKVQPSTLLIISFFLLISFGTGLLMMPEMTVAPGSMDFLDALFTATSASCVTGLIVVDTATFFTFKGHIVLLFLMQIGGIGIVTFGLFFLLLSRDGMGLKGQSALQKFFDASNLKSATSLLSSVIIITLVIELIGVVLMYYLWDPRIEFTGTGDKLFYSVFHTVSSFCNAGFSLFSDGFYEEYLRESYIMHVVIAMLIFFGSIGYHSIREVFSVSRLRDRMLHPWKTWEINTRISVYSSFALIFFGIFILVILEKDGVLEGKTAIGSIVASLFQSVSARTAGLNTVDIGAMAVPSILVIIFFMFIGGSSASTAGGIRTSTFVIIFISGFSTIRGKKELEIGNRQISHELLNKAFTILLFALTFILITVFALSITDSNKEILHIVFEAVSAFCTTGLSMGITGDLSDAGKIILTTTMFVGRVGILTLAYAVSTRVKTTAYAYPKAHVMIG